ncbi:MAG: hypothetical protein AAGE01_08455 [Pseudomonadota bacterium]
MKRRLSTLLALALLTAAPLASADFKRDYQEALEAIEDGDYGTARESLEAAIADEPGAKDKMRSYGMRFIPYVPHFYLGEALYNLGDCAGAVAAYDEAMSQGIIQGLDEFPALQQNRDACQASVVDVSAIADNASSAIDALEVAVRDLNALKDEPILASEWDSQAAWSGTLAEAEAALGSLRSQLDAAVEARDAETIENIDAQAMALSDRVQQTSGAASQRVAGLRAEEQRRVAQAAERARTQLASAVQSARSAASQSPPDAASRQAQNELNALIARFQQLGSNASTAAINQLSRELTGKVREFRTAVQTHENRERAIAARTPPAELKRIAEAYFAGQYDSAVQLANPAAFSDERARIQALLFRAASRFKQYTLGGAESTQLMSQVQADISSIKQLDRQFTPFVSAFPPKFTELFNASGRTASTAGG